MTASSTSRGDQAPPRGMRLVRAALGELFREKLENLGKNYIEGRADVLAVIAECTG